MKQIQSFIQSHKYAILWTIGYVFLMWLILDKMFNFPMFSAAAWNKLAHAHLRGFGGFVFGILILAALPLYVATTTVIVRTGKPLFSIQIPNWIKKLYTPPAPAKEENKETVTDTPAPNNTPSYDIPQHMPTELHGPYVRARMRKSYQNAVAAAATHETPNTAAPIAVAAAATPIPTTAAVPSIHDAVAPATPKAPESAPATAGELPLPTDFDFDIPDVPAFDTPMFKDISFDDETNKEDPTSDKTTSTSGAIADFLKSTGRNYSIDGDLIICGDIAIASHEDADFWIADEDTWFASGKQQPSPIISLQSAAARGLKPILYLGAKNILDLDERISAWESAGIIVIESPDELPN